jgi:hypothetical protein
MPWLPTGIHSSISEFDWLTLLIRYNVVHLVPGYHNISIMRRILDHADSKGVRLSSRLVGRLKTGT